MEYKKLDLTFNYLVTLSMYLKSAVSDLVSKNELKLSSKQICAIHIDYATINRSNEKTVN